MKEGIVLSAAFILSSFAFACACSYLTVIEECRPIRSFLVRKRPDFPDLEQVVPSSMADAVRKEICNNSEEETAHVSVSLPGLFGLTIIKTLECQLRSRVYSGLSLVNLNKKNRGTGWGPAKIKTRKSRICKIRESLSPRKLERVRYMRMYIHTYICTYVSTFVQYKQV